MIVTDATGVRLCILLLVGVAAAMPEAVAGENVLNRYRQSQSAAVADDAGRARIEGQVSRVHDDGIDTTVSVGQLRSVGIGDHDLVQIDVAGKEMRARLMLRDDFLEILRDKDARLGIDVDVVCIADSFGPASLVTIVGLGGGLTEWLQVRSGSAISLTRAKN